MPVDLAYREYGSGPPLIMLHGLLGSATNWSSIAQRIAGRHRALTVDLRNHGRSPHAEAMTYRDLVDDLLVFMDGHGLDRAAVLGHSLGGKVAMRLALEHPRRVEELIVVDIAPAAYQHDYGDILAAMEALDLTGITRRSDADVLLQPSIPDPAVRLFLLQNLVTGTEGYRWRVNLATLRRHVPDIVGFPTAMSDGPYRGKTLFIDGGRSDYVTAVHHALIRRYFPRARIATVANAGHWVHAEQPEAFLETLEGFLTPSG